MENIAYGQRPDGTPLLNDAGGKYYMNFVEQLIEKVEDVSYGPVDDIVKLCVAEMGKYLEGKKCSECVYFIKDTFKCISVDENSDSDCYAGRIRGLITQAEKTE